jgi:phosphoribosylanthranilate isomerase
MIVKICGITRAADAQAAVALGASAIGFIFWPDSARFIDPYRARAIAAGLPPFVTPVGVFVNQPATYVNAVAGLVRLGAVQLHGDETPDLLPRFHRPVVKAVARIDADTATVWPDRVRLLVDADDAVRRGGTGAKADWTAAAQLAAVRPIVLAGGLTPANVADAVRLVRPFGIDVSSGVEVSPGIKDPARMEQLFAALRGIARS